MGLRTFLLMCSVVFLSGTGISTGIPRAHAQNIFDDVSLSVAKYYPISEEVQEGDLISVEGLVYSKSKIPYDIGVIGVVVEKPALEINDTQFSPDQKTYPLVAEGKTFVRVSNTNGEVKKGATLTTSEIPGVAMKLTQPGFAVGVAEADVTAQDATPVLIPVMLHFQYSYGQEGGEDPSATGFNNFAALARLLDYRSPSAVLKYLFAAIVVIVAITFGYFSFARIASRGVEAVGRNPLASRSIQLSVFMNVAVTVVIVLTGLVLAFFIITL